MFLSGGVPEICPGSFLGIFRPLVRNIRPKKILAKFFAFFSRVGVRKFAPEVSSEISGGPEVPAPWPEVPVHITGSTAVWAGTTGPAGFLRVPLVGSLYRAVVPPFGPVLLALRKSEPNGQIFRAPI